MSSLERKLIKAELIQRREEGCNVDDDLPAFHAAFEGDVDEDALIATL